MTRKIPLNGYELFIEKCPECGEDHLNCVGKDINAPAFYVECPDCGRSFPIEKSEFEGQYVWRVPSTTKQVCILRILKN